METCGREQRGFADEEYYRYQQHSRSALHLPIGVPTLDRLLGQQATKVRAMDPIDPCEATGDRDAKDSKPSEVCGGDGGVRAGEGRDTALGVLRVAARQLRVWSVVTVTFMTRDACTAGVATPSVLAL
jgi:hypothetical protein